MNNFQRNIYRLYTEVITPIITCNATAASGGSGVTEYIIQLDKPLGGIVIMDFNAQGVVDKLEIIHNGVKKATSGMTTVNAGPFDDLYGNPTVPTGAEANAIDQFIGTSKGTIPNRDSTFLSETSITDITRTKQQLIWFVYTASDYNIANSVIIRITGPSGTRWDLVRLCTNQTPTGVTDPEPTPVYNYSISQCGTGALYNVDKAGIIVNIGDVIEFRPFGDVNVLPRCGTITSTTFTTGSADATINSNIIRDCGDNIHCNL